MLTIIVTRPSPWKKPMNRRVSLLSRNGTSRWALNLQQMEKKNWHAMEFVGRITSKNDSTSNNLLSIIREGHARSRTTNWRNREFLWIRGSWILQWYCIRFPPKSRDFELCEACRFSSYKLGYVHISSLKALGWWEIAMFSCHTVLAGNWGTKKKDRRSRRTKSEGNSVCFETWQYVADKPLHVVSSTTSICSRSDQSDEECTI